LLPGSVAATEVEPAGKFSRVPTGWTYFFKETPDQVNAMLTRDAQRIIDVHVVQASPLLLTGAAVTNTGSPYGRAWWWTYGQTAAQVGAALTANSARLTNLKDTRSMAKPATSP